MTVRIKEQFGEKINLKMKELFGYQSRLSAPKIKKVVVNVGFGNLVANKSKQEREKIYEEIAKDLAIITGQKSIATRAKKSIAAFKVRSGMALGAKVTLRRRKMNDFLERLINIALPRTRDFKGIDLKCIDQGGNLNFGIKEQISFPEIAPEKIKRIFGFEITIVTSAKSPKEAIELFKLLGFPLKNQ